MNTIRNTTIRKALATGGLLALSALAVPALAPAIAAADTPSMYDSCDASQEGHRITATDGTVLECVEVDTGTGYDWEQPS